MSGSDEAWALWQRATLDTLRRNKAYADAAIKQLSEEQLRTALDPDVNSIAVVMKHVAGNQRSRWTEFLTTDGEKPDRCRDGEFVDDYADRDAMLADWESGWRVMLDAIGALTAEDCLREVTIRGHRHPVPLAIQRSITHCSYHLGQIVQTARALAGEEWETLSVPRGESDRFNRERWGEASPPP